MTGPAPASSSPRFRRFSVLALLFTFAVIAWGGYVRATGSGAGCGAHWPACNGEVFPREPSTQTVIEFTHRVTSGLALLAVVALWLLARREHPAGHPARRWAGWSLAFMVIEAAAGAALVKLELVANNASANRAVVMCIHLAITFGLLAVMALTTWAAGDGKADARRPLTARGLWLVAAPVLVVVVGMTGAIAALGDTLVQQGVSTPFVDTLVRLRVLHPVLAIGGALGVVAAALTAWRDGGAGPLPPLVLGLLAAQVLVGLANVALAAPVWLQLTHLVLADALWVGLVLLVRAALGASAALDPPGLPRATSATP